MAMIKNFWLGGVGSTIQLGRLGSKLSSIFDSQKTKEVLVVTDEEDSLTNIRASDPNHPNDVVTMGWATGDNLIVGSGQSFTDGNVAIISTDTISSAIGMINAEIKSIDELKVNTSSIGEGPEQIPLNQDLGALAYADKAVITTVLTSPPSSVPGDQWCEYISDTQTVWKFHGFDGIIRSKVENWT